LHKNTPFYEPIKEGLNFRCIGPFRGGRSAAVAGVEGKTMLYYRESTGGGVWKTKNGGNSWQNISDGYFGGSIGSIAVSSSDNNVLYVGGGEVTVRGNVSYGYGVHKSVDGGRSWKHIGLENSKHIPRIRIHPKNPDIVYAAVLGDLYKPTQERGVYKSTDGGEKWERVLFSNENAGAVDLIMDPENPDIIYASTWNVRRTPYDFSSGGEGSALWKTSDGGKTWEEISKNEGCPERTLGIIGVTVSPVNPERVWTIIEAEKVGIYRSDDGGKTWENTNYDRNLRQRAWYYSRIYADSQDEDKVYVMNVAYHVSTDGGKTFSAHYAPHGDHHDLWIAPEDPERLIIADDGGAQISFDGGDNWTTYMNQPTAQFYRVTIDNSFPYRIHAAQQDNSTVKIRSRVNWGNIDEDDWESTAGGESAHIAVDPNNNDIVYGGSYGGFLTRQNHQNDQNKSINVWPDNPIGYGAEGMKYRFQWNFPVLFSPNEKNKLYAASNHLHVTKNEGQSWELISPDLTRNDPKTLGPSGGPITKDNTGVEYYGTIFAVAESPKEKNLIWTGSDDGLVHVTRDGGKNWKNVTPKKMPEWMMINSIEVNPFEKGSVYIVGTKYKSGDYKPYIYKTENYGKSWKLIVNGIESEDFTRTLRADPKRKGLMYTGKERGMYNSFNDGANWEKFQLNLPIVPITDLAIKDDNLIAATQGRSFWMIDDLTPIHQLTTNLTKEKVTLFTPKASYQLSGGNGRTSKTEGTNHPGGVAVYFNVNEFSKKDTISLSFYDASKKVIQKFSSHPNAKENEKKLSVKKGSNVFYWNMMYPDATKVKGMILWWASLNGPMALPGNYIVGLTANKTTLEKPFTILKNPVSENSLADMKLQFDFINDINTKISEIHKALINVGNVKAQIKTLKSSIKEKQKHKELLSFADELTKKITIIETTLYQTKSKSGQDPLNFPIRLNNKLAHLNSLTRMGTYKPTDQAIAFKNEITKEIDKELSKLYVLFDNQVKQLNQKVKDSQIDLIQIDK